MWRRLLILSASSSRSSGSEGIDEMFIRPMPPGAGRVRCMMVGETVRADPKTIGTWAVFCVIEPGRSGEMCSEENVFGPPDSLAGPVDCGSSDAIDLTKEPNYSANSLTRWTTSDGCDVRLDVAMTRSVACFDGVDEILLGWPLGTSSDHEYRLYIRDPLGVSGVDSASDFDPDATLPTDAIDSGLRQAGAELWIEGNSADAIWLVSDEGVEEWPEETPRFVCA